MRGTTKVDSEGRCSCVQFVDESSSSSSSSSSTQLQLSKHNFRKGSLQVLSITLSSCANTGTSSTLLGFNEAQTLIHHANHKQLQHHALLAQIEICSICCGGGGCGGNRVRGRVARNDNIFSRTLCKLFETNQVGECQVRLLADSRTIVTSGVLLPFGSLRGILVTEPFANTSIRHSNQSSLLSCPASFFCSACGTSNTTINSSPTAAKGAFSNWPSSLNGSSIDSNMDSLNGKITSGLKRKRKDGSNQGQASSSRRGEQLLQAAGRQLDGKESQCAESKKVERHEKVQNSLKMKLNETKSTHQMNKEFLVSPDMKDVYRRKSASATSQLSSSVASSSSTMVADRPSPSEASAVTTPATIGSNHDQFQHLVGGTGGSSSVITNSGGSSNWDDSCSPGETPGRTNLSQTGTDNKDGIACSLGYSKSGFESAENSMYLDHDYTYDECGSRSIFTELHDGEVPVPYEQTGNMYITSSPYPMSMPMLSSSSTTSFMGPGNSIFQTVMRGYHSNSLYSSGSKDANSSEKENVFGRSDGISAGTKDCYQSTIILSDTLEREDKGEEFYDFLREWSTKDICDYLNLKNVDRAVSTLDPYNVDCMVSLCQEIRSYFLRELLQSAKAPPVEVAFKMSSMVHAYVSPLIESTSPSAASKSIYKKHMSFLVDAMQLVSTILSEIVFMKHKLTSQVSIEMFNKVVLVATIVQITFQMELLRHAHIAHGSILSCDRAVFSTSKDKTAIFPERATPKKKGNRRDRLLLKITRTSERHVDSAITKLRLQLESSLLLNTRIDEDIAILCSYDLNRIVSYFTDVNDSDASDLGGYSEPEVQQPFKRSCFVSPSRSPGKDSNYEGKNILLRISKVYIGLQSLTGSKVIANCFPATSFNPYDFLNKISLRHFEDLSDSSSSAEKEIPTKKVVSATTSTKAIASQPFSFYAGVEPTTSRSNLFEIDVNEEVFATDLQNAMENDGKLRYTDTVLAQHQASRSRAPLDIISLSTEKVSVAVPSASSSTNSSSTVTGVPCVSTSSNSLLRRQSTLMVGHRAAMAGRLNKTKSVNLSVASEKKTQPVTFEDSKGFMTRSALVSDKSSGESALSHGRSLKRSVSEMNSRSNFSSSSSSQLSSNSRGSAPLTHESNERLMHLERSSRQKKGVGRGNTTRNKNMGGSGGGNVQSSKKLLRRVASVQETPLHLQVPKRISAVEETPMGKLDL